MTKALFIFNNAMAIMDEFSTSVDSEGRYAPNSNDTLEYKARSLSILNQLAPEVQKYSANYKPNFDGTAPSIPILESYDDELDFDDYICRTVLPYGLAAHLLLQEDPATAGFYQQRYEELLHNNKSSLGVSVDMVDVYSGYYNEELGEWVNCGNGIGFEGGGMWI